MTSKQRVFSGVQPTGALHLGNYLGALKQWVALQDTYDCLFCIVDLHALTVPPVDPGRLKQDVLTTLAAYLAAGIDPSKSTLFVQSAVMNHSHLAWLLGCLTPLGWLNRMTQFKDKVKAQKKQANLGLYAYPVLMAADVLLYRAHRVPVGEDQQQHVELMRDIAQAFNRHYGVQALVVPEMMVPPVGARIMSLQDGTVKMSKSDPSPQSRLLLTDSDEVLRSKIQRAKTDSLPLPRSLEACEGRPEVLNLLSLMAALTNQPLQSLFAAYGDQGFASFKRDLADVVVQALSPLRSNLEEWLKQPDKLEAVAQEGREKAQNLAAQTCGELHRIMGLA